MVIWSMDQFINWSIDLLTFKKDGPLVTNLVSVKSVTKSRNVTKFIPTFTTTSENGQRQICHYITLLIRAFRIQLNFGPFLTMWGVSIWYRDFIYTEKNQFERENLEKLQNLDFYTSGTFYPTKGVKCRCSLLQ